MEKNRTGKRGENMFAALIMEPWDQPDCFFDPTFFDSKFTTLDYYVELVGAARRYYFFVQVKSTPNGYERTGKGKRLKVEVNRNDLDRLESFPGPTYIVGIDQKGWKASILSANEYTPTLADFSTKFPLAQANMKKLWDEIVDYWSGKDMVLKNSHFVE